MPATLVVLNPGDVETSQPASAPSRRIPASIGPPPGPPPAVPPPPGSRAPREQGTRVQAPPRARSGARLPRRLMMARLGSRSAERLEAEQLEAALALSLSAVGAPPAVEMSEAPAVEMGEDAGRAGTPDGSSPASPALAASSVAEISREPSEIVESYNEPAAADAAVDGLADDDESEHMPLEAHT